MATNPESLTLEFTLTFEDHVAFNMHVLKRPPLSRLRLRREIITVALAPSYLLFGILLAWLLDSDRPPIADFFSNLLTANLGGTIKYIVSAYVVMTLCVLLARLSSRWRVRKGVRRTLKMQSNVDPSDPELKQTMTLTFDVNGIASETLNSSNQVKWAGVKRLDEPEHYIYLFLQPLRAFIVPRRVLRPGQTEQLLALAQAGLAAAHAQSLPVAPSAKRAG